MSKAEPNEDYDLRRKRFYWRKTLRWLVIIPVVLVLLALAGWAGRKGYRHWMEHKLVAEARNYSSQKDWRNTVLCLRRALNYNPHSPGATELMVNFLDRAGSTNVLSWRIKLAAIEPENVTNRLRWAQTAIRFNDLASAKTALDGVAEPERARAEYHNLAGALAWSQGQTTAAVQEYTESLRLEPNSPGTILNLESIRLASTNSTVYADACLKLQGICTNDTVGLLALQHLLSASVAHNDPSNAVSYAREIARRPDAAMADKIRYLDLLRVTTNADFLPWLASLKTAASSSAIDAYGLGKWLAKVRGPATACAWLQSLPATIQTNLPAPLVISECLVDLKDWNGLMHFISPQNWGALNYYLVALQSQADRSLGNDEAAQNDWSRAVGLAEGRLDRLTRLAQATKTRSWTAEHTQLLELITDKFPEEDWAANELMAEYFTDGNTAKLQDLLARLYADHPTDTLLQNNLADILLLRKAELDQAGHLARSAYESNTNNSFFMCTYAYSLLLQDRADEALKIMNRLPAQALLRPSLAAYYGTIQAEVGNKDMAREALARAQAGKLLPEEKAMVQKALAGL